MPRSTRPSFGAPSALLLAAALCTALLLPGCTAKEPPASGGPADLTKHPIYSKYDFDTDPKVITLATQPLAVPEGSLGEAMARDLTLQRDLARLGFRIRFLPFLKGGDINFFMDKGKVDAAIVGDMPTLMMAAKSAIRVGGLAKLGYGAVVLKNGMMLEDLRGKRIGYAPGTTGHFTLLEAIRQARLRETDVSLVAMDVNAMTAALSQNEIDGFASWEPAPTVAVATTPGTSKVFRMANSSYLYFSRPFVERNPEATRAIIASMIRSVRWMRADHRNLMKTTGWTLSSGKTLASGNFGATIEQIASITRESLLDISGAPLIPPIHLRIGGPLQMEFLFLQSQGKIPSTVSWETVRACFDTELAKSILSSSEGYGLDEFRYAADTP
jgi:ABC-type amino acid transport substrate-binding protein